MGKARTTRGPSTKDGESPLARGTAAGRSSPEQKVLARLAGGVAHDLNNILLVLQGYAEMAAEEAEAAPGMQSLLGEMRAATARASALVRDLLVIGERGVFSPRLLDLSEAIAARLPGLRTACPGIEIRASLAPELKPISADEEQVGRLLEVLCARSRDSMPVGGTLSIFTGPEEDTGRVILRLADTGARLTPEMEAHLFEPYLPGPGGSKGQGLGMPVVQAVVRRLGGEVSVRSGAKGTEVEVRLPAAAMHEPDASIVPVESREPAEEVRGAAGASGAADATVLVAEDDDGLRELAVKVLSREGYTVLAARDGQEAVQMFIEGQRRIGLVVMDDVMPRLGGRAALERIHALAPRCPLILCSGYDWRLTESAPRADPIPRSLLSKPWQPRDLVRRVREVLEGSGEGSAEGRPVQPQAGEGRP